MGYIYKIKNKIDNKIYIGQTTQDLESRWKGHRKNSSNCRYLKSALHLCTFKTPILRQVIF